MWNNGGGRNWKGGRMDCVRKGLDVDLECVERWNDPETLFFLSRAIIHIFAGSKDKWI